MLTTDKTRPIRTSDVCDRCGTRAKVRATLASGELYFCGHHARQTGNKLVMQSVQVYDPEGVFNYGRQG